MQGKRWDGSGPQTQLCIRLAVVFLPLPDTPNHYLSSEVKVAQLCPTLCNPMDYSPWNSPGQNIGVGSHSLNQTQVPHIAGRFFTSWATKEAQKVKVAQSCPTLCTRLDYTVHGILQAGILEWVAVPFSRESSQPRVWTQVSHIAGGFFTSWATREVNLSRGI